MKALLKMLAKKALHELGYELLRTNYAINENNQLRAAIELACPTVILDVGANAGQFGHTLRSIGYTNKIVSFEPLTSARHDLLAQSKKDEKWIVHPQSAVGDCDGFTEINISENSVSSSILTINKLHLSAEAKSRTVSSETVQIITLDSVASKYITEHDRTFVKIDTQGYEWQVLDGAKEITRGSLGVICELSLTPLYEGQKLWREIVDRLESDGFTLWCLQKGFTDPWTGRTLQMDGIFLRSDVVKNLGTFNR